MASRRLLLINTKKRIAMIAHDNRKHDLLDWARCNRGVLLHHDLFATGTTGSIIASELGLDITRFASGPRWELKINWCAGFGPFLLRDRRVSRFQPSFQPSY